jgi:hypothetical protein
MLNNPTVEKLRDMKLKVMASMVIILIVRWIASLSRRG